MDAIRDYVVFTLAFTSANLLTDLLRPLLRKATGKKAPGRPRKPRPVSAPLPVNPMPNPADIA